MRRRRRTAAPPALPWVAFGCLAVACSAPSPEAGGACTHDEDCTLGETCSALGVCAPAVIVVPPGSDGGRVSDSGALSDSGPFMGPADASLEDTGVDSGETRDAGAGDSAANDAESTDAFIGPDGGPNPDAAGGDAANADAANLDAGMVDAGPVPTSVVVTPSMAETPVGLVVQLAAEARYAMGQSADVTEQASWQSSVDFIARVDDMPGTKGRVLGRSVGNASITATYGGVSGSASVQVTPAIVVSLSARNKHILALESDGTVWGWGWNEYGQLSASTTTVLRTPVQIAISDVAQIEAGGLMSFAVKRDGSVWAWGNNASGNLGNGASGVDRNPAPSRVLGPNGVGFLAGVEELSAGYDFAVARLTDGTLWAWGANAAGQLGDSTTSFRTAPTRVGSLANITKVAAGAFHGLAIRNDGAVYSWGYNSNGQLGVGTSGAGTDATSPVQVHGPGNTGFLSGVTAVSGGWGSSVALTADGRVHAWGWNASSQLGDGGVMDRPFPGLVVLDASLAPLFGVAAVRSSFMHVHALLGDGRMVAWGFNDYGQLGDGTRTRAPYPVGIAYSGGARLSNVESFASAGDAGHALLSNASIVVWGSNLYGEQGDGQTADQLSAVVMSPF